MHTGIAIVVEADDATHAVCVVEQFNEHNAQWSDWNEHGGRWSDVVEGSVLRYSDNPDKFRQILEQFRAFTEIDRSRLLEQVGELRVGELVSDPKYQFYTKPNVNGLSDAEAERVRNESLTDSLKLWRAIKLLELAQGTFGPDQHFFDAEAHAPDLRQLDERVAANPDRQFLVIWDYHH
jgi:hypothetical protein